MAHVQRWQVELGRLFPGLEPLVLARGIPQGLPQETVTIRALHRGRRLTIDLLEESLELLHNVFIEIKTEVFEVDSSWSGTVAYSGQDKREKGRSADRHQHPNMERTLSYSIHRPF